MTAKSFAKLPNFIKKVFFIFYFICFILFVLFVFLLCFFYFVNILVHISINAFINIFTLNTANNIIIITLNVVSKSDILSIKFV